VSRRRRRFRFKGRVGSRLVWEASLPNDSRVEQLTADARWFYATMTSKH